MVMNNSRQWASSGRVGETSCSSSACLDNSSNISDSRCSIRTSARDSTSRGTMAAAANRVDITSHTQGSHRSSSLVAVISTGMAVARVSVEATTLSLPAAMGATDSPGWPLPEWDTAVA